ncbi:MAG: short-chain dehydrogenase [Caulobacteraceae bacterium]|nr:short-chain dehydrogenase [Caulobacteraceae bacterium]
MDSRSHAGRVALVTGASSGVGAHLAKLLAGAGASVVAGARRVERLETLVAGIAAAGGEAMAVALDVEDEASVQAACDAAEARYGRIDTVVAAAGMSIAGPTLTMDVDDFDQVMRVNLRGAFLTARETARRMIARGEPQGRIVLVASIGGRVVLPGLAAYCASKAGLIMLGRSMALEWARHGLSVNVLAPAYMLTEINQDWFASQAGKAQIASFPRRRLMPLEALDPGVLYLTSDAAAYTTGTVLEVDDAQAIA